MEATVDAFLSVRTFSVPSFWRDEDDKWIAQNVKNKDGCTRAPKEQISSCNHRLPKLDIWAALYMLTFALLRDSSDLHIYKDLYGKDNDCFCNLWKFNDLNKKSSYLTLA